MKIINHYGCIYQMSNKKYFKFLTHIAKHDDFTLATDLTEFGAKKVGLVALTTRSLQGKEDAKFLLDWENRS